MLGDGMLVLILLEFCTSYCSSCHQHPLYP